MDIGGFDYTDKQGIFLKLGGPGSGPRKGGGDRRSRESINAKYEKNRLKNKFTINGIRGNCAQCNGTGEDPTSGPFGEGCYSCKGHGSVR